LAVIPTWSKKKPAQTEASLMIACFKHVLPGPHPGITIIIIRLGDTIRMEEKPRVANSSKLSRAGQLASMACIDLPEMTTLQRLSCLRTGNWSVFMFSPSGNPSQHEKLAMRSVGAKRCTNNDSDGSEIPTY
jgi:hypothetical protein